jgi:hypothetical protein
VPALIAEQGKSARAIIEQVHVWAENANVDVFEKLESVGHGGIEP